jgi:hypothetical protein
MKILLIFAFVFSSNILLATTKIGNWQLKNDLKTTKVWQNKKFSSLYVSIEKSTVENTNDYTNALKGSEDEDKAKVLALIGVSSWKANKRNWKKIGDKNLYVIEGSYIDNSDQDIRFQEYHFIKDKVAMKIIFTSDSKKALENKKDIETFLKQINHGDVNE